MAIAKIQKMLRQSPRYVLRPGDSKLIRYTVKGRNRKDIVSSKFTDISAGGLSFTANAFEAPEVGEVVAMDFDVPSSKKIATYGRVVRVEHLSEDHDGNTQVVKVAVEFAQLPPQYQDLLEKKVTEAVLYADASDIRRRWAERADRLAGDLMKWGKHAIYLVIFAFAIIGFVKVLQFAEKHQPTGGPIFGKQFSDWIDKRNKGQLPDPHE